MSFMLTYHLTEPIRGNNSSSFTKRNQILFIYILRRRHVFSLSEIFYGD